MQMQVKIFTKERSHICLVMLDKSKLSGIQNLIWESKIKTSRFLPENRTFPQTLYTFPRKGLGLSVDLSAAEILLVV